MSHATKIGGIFTLNSSMSTLLLMGLRGAALVSRFVLSMYVVKYLGLDAMGVFGLLAGAAAIAPPALGFGIGFFLHREMVGKPEAVAAQMLRDRLVFTIAASLVGAAIACAWTMLTEVRLPSMWLVVPVLVLEVVAFDLHLALLSLRLATLANVLVAIRSSAWVVPFIAAGLLDARFRSIDFLLQMWLTGLVLMYVVMVYALRHWPWSVLTRAPVDWSWIGSRLRGARMIHASDIALVGSAFLDRFIVNHFLGVTQTGVFVFYWSLANAIHVLVQSSLLQVALPDIISARERGLKAHSATLRALVLRVAATGAALSIGMFVVCIWLLPYLGQPLVVTTVALFSSLLLAFVLRLVADTLSYGLYSRKLDAYWAGTNMSGFVASALFATAGTLLGGVIGAAVALIAVSLVQIATRLWILNTVHDGERDS